MPTVKHPRIPHVTVEVPDSDVKRWEASGWVNLVTGMPSTMNSGLLFPMVPSPRMRMLISSPGAPVL